jgi:hypothetical protein
MGVMPYRLEKGPVPLVLEEFFNQGLDEVACDDTAQAILDDAEGPRRRLRAIWRYSQIGQALRTDDLESLKSVTPENSIMGSRLFTSPMVTMLKDAGVDLAATVAQKWLGMEPDGDEWQRPAFPDDFSGLARRLPTVGHWAAYFGNVELILVETLQRMLEVSLGVDHLTAPPATEAEQQQVEEQLQAQATRVWPVYLFLTCPQPWFETWITWQCHARTSAVRGQVTVQLSTPGHERPVTPSPIDLIGDNRLVPDELAPGTLIPNPYFLNGMSDAPFNSGYEGKVIRATAEGVIIEGHDPVDTALHDRAGQGMWVVSHANHDSTITMSSFDPEHIADFALDRPRTPKAFDLAPIAHYRFASPLARRDVKAQLQAGAAAPDLQADFRDVVVVSPAALDGGVPSEPLFGDHGGDQ